MQGSFQRLSMTFPFCPAALAATMFLQIGEARCDPKDGTNA